MGVSKLFETIDARRQQLDGHRPFPRAILENLREHLIVEWTYNTNAIEGNTLTLSETKVVLEGITVGGKTLHEHLEVINHREAILYLEDIVHQREPLTERTIKSIHAIVMKGFDDKEPGAYRSRNVLISGARHRPPEHFMVPQEMSDLLKWYNTDGKLLHPVERAARLHSLFVKTHPFMDGNGRTARLLLNFELMLAGYFPIVIRREDRLEYYQALDKSHVEDDFTDFIEFVATCVLDTLGFYLGFLK